MINLSQFTTIWPSVTVTSSSVQDGFIVTGRAGGLSSFRISLVPAQLSDNRTITFPDVTGTVITSGDSETVTDAMLSVITSPGKVTNSATTATSANTPDAIVTRDLNGNFAAGIITAALIGNASTATALENPRTISFTGDILGNLTTNLSSNETVSLAIGTGVIVNADINASAAIADTKLATIQTTGKVANSATTATSASFANAIVARDATGNFAANLITAALQGNASTATALQVARTISYTGDVTGSVTTALGSNVSIDLSIASEVIYDDNISPSAAIADGKLATIQTVGKVANSATTATSSNSPNTIVARDGSGNFTAGSITASLNGTALYAQTAGPVGSIIYYPKDSPPAGYLALNGASNLNTYAYRQLHAVISNTWGGTAYNPGVTDQPGALTLFSIPDLRNRFIVSSGQVYGIGDIGGLDNVTLTTAQMPSHTHSVNDPGHAHVYQASIYGQNCLIGGGRAVEAYGTSTSSSYTGISLYSAGGGGAHENRPPYFALLPCIKY